MSLVPLPDVQDHSPAMREVAVSSYLEHAKEWLSTAVEMTGPDVIAGARAEIATAAEATKQLGLSREIQLDAEEMVRRAEYALGKAVRKGQAEGEVGSRADAGWTARNLQSQGQTLKTSTEEIFTSSQQRTEIYALSDNATPDQFEAALGEARAEGNPSRANVVRKVKQANLPTTRDAKADVISDLAAEGYSSRQMVDRLGVSESRVREIARAYDIEIPADAVIGKQVKRMDHTAAVESAVTELENWAGSLKYIDLTQVDFSEADEWAASLTDSLTELRRFIKQIKETTHV